MIRTDLDFNSAQTQDLKTLCRRAMIDVGEDDCCVGKMSRDRLVKRLNQLVSAGVIELDGREQPKAEEKPAAGAIRFPMPEQAEQCLRCLLEALRCYSRYEIWVRSGRAKDPQTRQYIDDARELVRQAVGCCVDATGSGWEKGYKLSQVVDSALVRLRYDFSETMTSTSVMSSLLSDRHTVEMAAAAAGQ